MKAGFARMDITPPLGTPLGGVGEALQRRCTVIHDPIYLRALWIEEGGHEALVLGFDLCFLAREETDRFKGMLARNLKLWPSQVLMATSHTHAGPATGTFSDLFDAPPLRDYLRQIENAMLQGARQARDGARTVRLRAGTGRSTLPVNRRCRRDGQIVNAPNPGGPILDSMPLSLFEDEQGRPVCLLYSVSTHPVAMRGKEASADYPGAACALLDRHLGATCSFFLQGAGGDSRPRPLVQGADWNFQSGWADVEACARIVADEVIDAVGRVLQPVTPRVRTALVETEWPFQPPDRALYAAALKRSDYQETPDKPTTGSALMNLHQKWAARQLELLARGALRRALPVQFQGIQLAEGVRLVGIEGELLSPHGRAIERAFAGGVTYPLGYANGEGMYLPSSEMLDEGGYEVESYHEFNEPAMLAKGMETIRDQALAELKRQGIG